MSSFDGMDPTFAQRLQSMIMAAASQGVQITVTSGYRSPELQSQLFANAVKKYGSESAARKWVAPPGKSNHNKGIAADLGGDLAWVHKHAAEFGLWFPMSWEPWHIETAGSRDGSAGGDASTTPPDGTSAQDDPVGRQVANLFAALTSKPSDPIQLVQEAVSANQKSTTPSTAGKAPAGGGSGWGGGGSLDPHEVAKYAYEAGFRGQALAIIVAISQRESGYNPGATGDVSLQDGTWGPSVGLFQIRTLKDQTGSGGDRDISRLQNNPAEQARAAWVISQGGTNWGPWALNGDYRNKLNLPAAEAIAREVEAQMGGS